MAYISDTDDVIADSQSLVLKKTDGGNAEARKLFAQQTGSFTAEWLGAGLNANPSKFYWKNGGGRIGLGLYLSGDSENPGTGLLKVFSGTSATVVMTGITADPYLFRVKADIANQTYDVYVNNVLKADNFNFLHGDCTWVSEFYLYRGSASPISVDNLTITPEPTTMLLLGLGGLLSLRRRR